MRSLIVGLIASVTISAVALAQTNPNMITVTFTRLAEYDTLVEQDIYYRGAVFKGGTLTSGYSTNNARYISPCYLRCGNITIDVPPGSNDVSFDVIGWSRDYSAYTYKPIYMFHGGSTVSLGPTIDSAGNEWDEHVILGRSSTGHIELYGNPTSYWFVISIDNVTFTPPSTNTYLVKASLGTDANPSIERMAAKNVQQVVVPLGGELRLGVEVGALPSGSPEDAMFSLSQPAFILPLPGSPRLTSILFPYNSIIPFKPGTAEKTKSFQAVHQGITTVRITPVARPGDAFDVQVRVVMPSTIGPANAADTWINDVAHRTGLLPQMVKAQVKQESNFDPDAFRYEPWNDVTLIQPRIQSVPYRDYTAPNPRGAKLLADDLNLRQRCFSCETA